MPISRHRTDAPDEAELWSDQLEQWRLAAQRVESAWEVWLASDGAERDWAHQVYLDALAREEQAALRLERCARGAGTRRP